MAFGKRKKGPRLVKPDYPEPLQIPGVRTRRKLRKGGLAQYLEKVAGAYAGHIVPELFESLRRGLAENSAHSQKLTAEIFGYTGEKLPTLVFNNTSTFNAIGHPAPTVNSGGRFDSIVRRLEMRERGILEPGEGEVIDVVAEVKDVSIVDA